MRQRHPYLVIGVLSEVLGLLHQGLFSRLAAAKGVGGLLRDRLLSSCNIPIQVS